MAQAAKKKAVKPAKAKAKKPAARKQGPEDIAAAGFGITPEQGREVVRLRDEGMAWSDVAIETGISEKGYTKKTKKVYAAFSGKPASGTATKAAPRGRKGTPQGDHSASEKAVRDAEGKPSRKRSRASKAKAGMTTGQAQQALASGRISMARVFEEGDADEYVTGIITGHRVVVLRSIPSIDRDVIDEMHVHKVNAYGTSPKSGVRWVRFTDTEQKSRTVPVLSIVGVN